MEAVDKIEELFPNLSSKSRPEITAMVNQLDGGDYLPDDLVKDEEAGYMGLPFNHSRSLPTSGSTRSTGTRSTPSRSTD